MMAASYMNYDCGLGELCRGWRLVLPIIVLGLQAGCSGLLDVENPNQILREDLNDPVASNAVANGALSTVARGVASTILPVAVVGDELKWVGSYDSGRELEQGNLSNRRNEFTMGSYPNLAEGRWMADEAIRLLGRMDADGTLPDRNDLARACLYAAVAYVTIPDLYSDFTISDGREAGPPIGEAHMITLYDKAIEYLDQGLEIAEATGSLDLMATLLAMRVRARHARGVWLRIHSEQGTYDGAYVTDGEMVSDAEAFLQLPLSGEWEYRFNYSVNTIANTLGAWINERREFRIGDGFVIPDASGKLVQDVIIEDPIDSIVDPVVAKSIAEFVGARQYGPLTVVSSREVRLILAEAALATGDTAVAIDHINHIRSLNSLTPYTGQVPIDDILKHSRRVNLFLQGRRLNDMYRFGDQSPLWLPNSEAMQSPGTKLPIADIEVRSNCHLVGAC